MGGPTTPPDVVDYVPDRTCHPGAVGGPAPADRPGATAPAASASASDRGRSAEDREGRVADVDGLASNCQAREISPTAI